MLTRTIDVSVRNIKIITKNKCSLEKVSSLNELVKLKMKLTL